MEPAPAWRVTEIRDTTIIVPNGGPVRAKRVSFVLADGTPSYIEVPLDSFTQSVVGAEIDKLARQHYSIIGLQSTEMVTPAEG